MGQHIFLLLDQSMPMCGCYEKVNREKLGGPTRAQPQVHLGFLASNTVGKMHLRSLSPNLGYYLMTTKTNIGQKCIKREVEYIVAS